MVIPKGITPPKCCLWPEHGLETDQICQNEGNASETPGRVLKLLQSYPKPSTLNQVSHRRGRSCELENP